MITMVWNHHLLYPPSHDTCTCTKVSLHETSWVVGTSWQIIREHEKPHVFHKTLSPNHAHSPMMQGNKVHLSPENSAKCWIDHLRHRAKHSKSWKISIWKVHHAHQKNISEWNVTSVYGFSFLYNIGHIFSNFNHNHYGENMTHGKGTYENQIVSWRPLKVFSCWFPMVQLIHRDQILYGSIHSPNCSTSLKINTLFQLFEKRTPETFFGHCPCMDWEEFSIGWLELCL